MPHFFYQGRLHYTDKGGTGEALLFLHGLGSRGSDWNFQLAAFSEHYRVITLDFPGHGDSEALKGGTSMARLALCARKLLDHLDIEQAHICGLSLGGMVSFQLAVDAPEYVRSLVIINSAPGPGRHRLKFNMLFTTRKLLMAIYGVHGIAPRISENLFPEPSQQNLRQQFLHSMYASDPTSYRKIADAIVEFNLDSHISGIAIPTLVLSADQDYTPVKFKREYVAKMPNAQLQVIANSRHASPLDSPEACNRAIKNFLESLPLGASHRNSANKGFGHEGVRVE